MTHTEALPFERLAALPGARLIGHTGHAFTRLSYDSRIISDPSHSCFLAIRGDFHDGHDFIEAAYRLGVRCFICTDLADPGLYPDAGFAIVPDVMAALHALAAQHRSQFSYPVIGITGSNGKTVVKEWLTRLLVPAQRVVRSPKSYNSQLGVPLSLWNLSSADDVAIIECGISKPGEMENLATIVQPTIGVFTHVGNAHLEHFIGVQQLVEEKCRLFTRAEKVFYPAQQPIITEGLAAVGFSGEHCTWGAAGSGAMLELLSTLDTARGKHLRVFFKGREEELFIPFKDDGSVSNALLAYMVAEELGAYSSAIRESLSSLSRIEMRLERFSGWNGAVILSDVYNNDLNALELSLDELSKIKGVRKRMVLLSDILESGIPDEVLYPKVAEYLKLYGIDHLVTVGDRIRRFRGDFDLDVICFSTTDDLLQQVEQLDLSDAAVLLKGARTFRFERIVQRLQRKVHASALEIHLPSMLHNLNFYRSHIHSGARVMAMVKAFGYGTGEAPVAGMLEYHGVHQLGVAYVNEGVALRKQGVRLPILVLNPDAGSFGQLIEHRLEPEIYSLKQLRMLDRSLQRLRLREYPIHLKVDTGMHRLGFTGEALTELLQQLSNFKTIRVVGVMSHLAAADMPEHDDYTRHQINLFNAACEAIQRVLGYRFKRHICNTAGMLRFPEAQGDMVRLGIGLYGAPSCAEDAKHLQPVAHLRSVISQIRQVDAGASVGYTRAGIADHARMIATIPVGYADGYRRSLSNGKGRVWIRGQYAPVTGNVCMDMIMVDVTSVPGVQEGDEVVLFGDAPTISEVALAADTIPYEILSGISARLRRIYVHS